MSISPSEKRMPSSAVPTFKRLRLEVKGIVQGVGFRPFVYQLALKHALDGFVLNNGSGVVIEIEGPQIQVEGFVHALEASPPPLARIDRVQRKSMALLGKQGFTIRRSATTRAVTMVSPDMAICDACRAELFDPDNRRYRYALINCTDCGPRYSIISSLPYDRPNTSMRFFMMCPACEAEYNDPANRRYHAQPISCFACGPRLHLWYGDSKESMEESECIEAAAKLISEGKIVAVKGMGGFHLMCDASNATAVQTLRERKRRPSKPLAVMFPSLKSIKMAAEVSETEERLILSKERPIVIVRKTKNLPSSSSQLLAPGVAPGIDRIGVFLPYTPLHLLLMDVLRRPIVATSANLSEEPIIVEEAQVRQKLGTVIDAMLEVDREIVNACDDSVVMDAGGQMQMLRMARGYAPKSLPLTLPTRKKILAVGANQKNTIALAFGEEIVLSPHIGDLVSIDAFEYFERTLETFKRFYDFEPDVVVCDLHPGYETTKWAQGLRRARPGIRMLQVQHHYAHALACMAEYGVKTEVLAFSFDGTGYGEDGTLWGGEVLRADLGGFSRVLHLRPFRLIGGEKAIREPRRVALSLLFECYSLETVLAMENPTVKSFEAHEIRTLHTMWERGINAPLCSSVGRLFDAVASLAGTAQVLGYEAQSGLLLEAAAAPMKLGEPASAFRITSDIIDWAPLLDALLANPSPGEASALLHDSLSQIIVQAASLYPQLPVLLTGGVFQNCTLLTLVKDTLETEGRSYYVQRDTPLNDGGIALGQLYYALHREEA